MDSLVQVHHLLILIFIGGYAFIALESFTQLNKATAAILMAVACWVIEYLNPFVSFDQNQHILTEKVGEISQVIFYLLGALIIVEVINVHHGFKILTDLIKIRSKRGFLWTIASIAFLLSAVLDNLTATLILSSMMIKLVHEQEERLLFGAAIVVAANAGGAWTPIGDVTSTMLWIGGQISAGPLIRDLILPCIASVVVTVGLLAWPLKGRLKDKEISEPEEEIAPIGKLVFFVGLGGLVFVPVFKELTHLPPFMGAFLALGVLWIVTDLAHRNRVGYDHLKVPQALGRVDMSSVLFFLGILLCVAAIDAAGLLKEMSDSLLRLIPNLDAVVVVIGFVSAIIDNVPIVAATQSMFSLSDYPMNDELWQLIAYVAGTGGSILVIGSAAGVALMGMLHVPFFWWCKRITIPVSLGYFAGIGIYWLQLLF